MIEKMAAIKIVADITITSMLIYLAIEDWRRLRLPNELTAILVVAGFAFAHLLETQIVESALGCLFGYCSFIVVSALYRLTRGREGLGRGDAKLLGGLGAWVGWQGLPSVVLLAAGLALCIVVGCRVAGRPFHRDTLLPFGSFLSIAGWVVWMRGPLNFG